jgi:type I restriction enzyme M protein
MFKLVGERVFPFLRELGGEESAYATHMTGARFTIPTPALLTKDKEQMRLDSMSDLELWCNDLRHNMVRQLAPLISDRNRGEPHIALVNRISN